MQKTKTELQNGTVNKVAKRPNVKTKISKPTPHSAVKETMTTKPSLEERIQKADELKSLTLKRARTINTLHHLRSFNFASDDNCTLTITDSEHQQFETSNSNLIGMLKEHLISVLSNKVSELDDEIIAFNL